MSNPNRNPLRARHVNVKLRLRPIGATPAPLEPDEQIAWSEIIAAMPIPATQADGYTIANTARLLAQHRREPLPIDFLRELYRELGCFLIPMKARRGLVFPGRPAKATTGGDT